MSVANISNLRVRKGGRVICAIDELRLESGERLGVHGPNGSGKSSLLRVLARLERDVEGRCSLGVPASETTLVHQQPYLLRGGVLANVAYGLRVRGVRRATARAQALDWLERLGAEALVDRPVRGLSGGERRRVALARAFALSPSLLLLDEPFADLDAEGRERVTQTLVELPAKLTIVVAEPQPSQPWGRSVRSCVCDYPGSRGQSGRQETHERTDRPQ